MITNSYWVDSVSSMRAKVSDIIMSVGFAGSLRVEYSCGNQLNHLNDDWQIYGKSMAVSKGYLAYT